MNLSTNYLGFKLPHPLMPGASPLTEDLDSVRRLEDAGAAAIVMHSLFEEQIVMEEELARDAVDAGSESSAEAHSHFPSSGEFRLRPPEYLEQIRRIKEAVDIPVIASLNGMTPGGWLRYAQQMESAGADAIELNVYYLAALPEHGSGDLENRTLRVVQGVRQAVRIPVAVKLSPYYTSLPLFARELCRVNVDGLVLFNRFYQPDIDIENLEVIRTPQLSRPSDSLLRLRLRWLAILSGRIDTSLAVSGGVHTVADAIKAVMTGAHAVQMTSALLQHGPEQIAKIRVGLSSWLERHEYESLAQMQGCMNLTKYSNPRAYERANYAYILQTWGSKAAAQQRRLQEIL